MFTSVGYLGDRVLAMFWLNGIIRKGQNKNFPIHRKIWFGGIMCLVRWCWLEQCDDMASCRRNTWQTYLEFFYDHVDQIHVTCGIYLRVPSGNMTSPWWWQCRYLMMLHCICICASRGWLQVISFVIEFLEFYWRWKIGMCCLVLQLLH